MPWFVYVLKKELGFTETQAELYTSMVLGQNAETSADCVMTNGLRVIGSWVRGEQEGNVGGWLSTMKETWQFNDDLTYEHKIERYESAITTGPFFQSSYSRPDINLERGISNGKWGLIFTFDIALGRKKLSGSWRGPCG